MFSGTRFVFSGLCLSSVALYLSLVDCVSCQRVLHIRGTSDQDTKSSVPSFVEEYAPLIYLHSLESYFPSSLQTHLGNVQPRLNYTLIKTTKPSSLGNLDELNKHGSKDVYLTAKHSVARLPGGAAQEWLYGEKPDKKGKCKAAIPVVVAPKDGGIVDVFWLTFYSYNEGNNALGFSEFGDHVGDWEHTMIRFKNGAPQAIWLSQHGKGQAFSYKSLQKKGKRPIIYSAKGTHALYATASVQVAEPQVVLGLNLSPFLPDYTDDGTLWDPLLTTPLYYDLDGKAASDKKFKPAAGNPVTANWLYFNGQWGDKSYNKSTTAGQVDLGAGIIKFTDGPTGPNNGADKDLSRKDVCPGNIKDCTVADKLPKTIGLIEHLLAFAGCKIPAGE